MKRFLILSVLICLLSSCEDPGSESGGGSGAERSLAFLDIAGAHTLYVAPQNNTGRSMRSSSINVLHSIDDEGTVKEVPFLDESKNVIPPINVEYVVNVNDNYILLRYSGGATGGDVILSDKMEDGKVYSLKNAGYPITVPFDEDYKDVPYICVNNGFLYFVANEYDKVLMQVDLKTMQATAISRDADKGKLLSGDSFFVDKDGNVAYKVDGSGGFYLRKATTKIFEKINDTMLFTLFGEIFARIAQAPGPDTLYSLSIDESGTVSKTTTYTFPILLELLDTTPFTSAEGKTFLLPKGSGRGLFRIYEINESARTITNAEGANTAFDTVLNNVDYATSDNYIYVANHEKIVRMSFSDYSFKTFNLPSNYQELISISPTDNTVGITASLNTGQTVVSELNCTTGVFKTLTESSSSTITLERIR